MPVPQSRSEQDGHIRCLPRVFSLGGWMGEDGVGKVNEQINKIGTDGDA